MSKAKKPQSDREDSGATQLFVIENIPSCAQAAAKITCNQPAAGPGARRPAAAARRRGRPCSAARSLSLSGAR